MKNLFFMMSIGRLLRSAIASCLIFSLPTNAFYGIDLIPGACMIACGPSGGVLSGAVGGLMKGWIFGPSIDEFDGKLKGTLEEFRAKAEVTLGNLIDKKGNEFLDKFDIRVTAQRKAFTSDLEDIASSFSEQMDEVFTKQAASFKNTTKEGAGDVGGTLEDFAMGYRNTIFLAIFTFASIAVFLITKFLKIPIISYRFAAWIIPVAVISVMSWSFLRWYSNHRSESIICNAYVGQDISALVFYTERAKIASGDRWDAVAANDVAISLRDSILSRKAHLGKDGLSSLIQRLINSQNTLVSNGKEPDIDADAMISNLLWQYSDQDKRVGEFMAAQYAARALINGAKGSKCGPDSKPIGWEMALAILDSYLIQPIQPRDWKRILVTPWGEVLWDQASGDLEKMISSRAFAEVGTGRPQIIPLEKLKETLSVAQQHWLPPQGSQEFNELATRREERRSFAVYEARGREAYARALWLSAIALGTLDPNKRDEMIRLRNQIGQQGIDYWEEFLTRAHKAGSISAYIDISRTSTFLQGRTEELIRTSPDLLDKVILQKEDVDTTNPQEWAKACRIESSWEPPALSVDPLIPALEKLGQWSKYKLPARALAVSRSLDNMTTAPPFAALEVFLLSAGLPNGTTFSRCKSDARGYWVSDGRDLAVPYPIWPPTSSTRYVVANADMLTKRIVVNRKVLLSDAMQVASYLGLYVCRTPLEPEQCTNPALWIPLAEVLDSDELASSVEGDKYQYSVPTDIRKAVNHRVGLL